MAVLQSSLEKEGKTKKNKVIQHLVTHPGTNSDEQGLTLMSGRNILLSLSYSDSTLNAFF